jgi:hypothetical protein
LRKSSVFLFVFLTLAWLGVTLVPQVSSQPENIKVLSYGWYVDSIGFLDVVGEVQNVGPNTIDTVVLSGTIYATDGEAKAYSSPTIVFVKYLVPQQKAPFYMEFPPQNSVTGDLSWLSLGIDHVDFTVSQAEVTSSYQYPDLTVASSSGAVDSEGVYWVSGTVQNTGSQTARNIHVVGTFFNASDTVVAVGYSDYLTPLSLSPSSTESFKLGAFDLNQSLVPSNLMISSYSLLVQTESPILSGEAPSPTPTPSNPPSDNTPSPTGSSGSENPNGLAPEAVYAIVAVIVIIGLAVTLLLIRKTKSQEISQTKKSRKAQRRKKPKSLIWL